MGAPTCLGEGWSGGDRPRSPTLGAKLPHLGWRREKTFSFVIFLPRHLAQPIPGDRNSQKGPAQAYSSADISSFSCR